MHYFSNCTSAQNHELYDDLNFIADLIISDNLSVYRIDSHKWIDTLYKKTLEYKNGDISETLFLLTFATLQFRAMPLEIPFTEMTMYMPLPRPPDSLFYERNKYIPAKFPFAFFNAKNEKDKYSHFFGNAFLAFNVRIFNLTKFMGIFVEYFEDAFKVEGAVDLKDISVNQLGEIYGEMLCENPDMMPSESFKFIEFLFSVKFYPGG